MRIALASDHAGFELKQKLIEFLEGKGEVTDLGTYDEHPVDYPDFAWKLGQEVVSDRADRGILMCGSGVGASIAANKIPGIRAAICHDSYSAHQGVEHDDMNVLVLGTWVVAIKLAEELIEVFLNARFSKEPRHVRRLHKVEQIERGLYHESNKAS